MMPAMMRAAVWKAVLNFIMIVRRSWGREWFQYPRANRRASRTSTIRAAGRVATTPPNRSLFRPHLLARPLAKLALLHWVGNIAASMLVFALQRRDALQGLTEGLPRKPGPGGLQPAGGAIHTGNQILVQRHLHRFHGT